MICRQKLPKIPLPKKFRNKYRFPNVANREGSSQIPEAKTPVSAYRMQIKRSARDGGNRMPQGLGSDGLRNWFACFWLFCCGYSCGNFRQLKFFE
jgi:hypothetical protein